MARTTTDNTLVADALSARADQHRRAATSLAGQCSGDDRAGKDIRPSALLVTRELARAADLDRIATGLTEGTLTLMVLTVTPAARRNGKTAKARRAAAHAHIDTLDSDALTEAAIEVANLITADLTPEHDTDDTDADGIIDNFDPDKD